MSIIKSLLISKITHVLLSLPSPNRNTFCTLENMFKTILSNKKTPKFRQEIVENLTNLVGLKLTNLRNFYYSLKISWIKRIITQTEVWAEFPTKMNIQKLIQYGDLYPEKLLG